MLGLHQAIVITIRRAHRGSAFGMNSEPKASPESVMFRGHERFT